MASKLVVPLKLLVLTTAQRDTLTPVTGMEIFNSTLGAKQSYDGSRWITEVIREGIAGGATIYGGTGNTDNLTLNANSGTNAGVVALAGAAIGLTGVVSLVGATAVTGNLSTTGILSSNVAAGTGTAGGLGQTITGTATADDVTEQTKTGVVLTTGATVTSIMNWSNALYPNDIVWNIYAKVIARRTGGSSGTAGDVATFGRSATFKDIGGVCTQIGATAALWDHESQAGWDVTFDISAETIRLRVTGAANNDITWHAITREMRLSA